VVVGTGTSAVPRSRPTLERTFVPVMSWKVEVGEPSVTRSLSRDIWGVCRLRGDVASAFVKREVYYAGNIYNVVRHIEILGESEKVLLHTHTILHA